MGERISISTPDGDFSAYVARPKADTTPAVVVIQEIFGVNQVMRDITDGLAAQGYLAICPDLFWRIEPGIDITDKSEAEWKRAFELFNTFDVDAGVDDIQAAINAIRTEVDAAASYYGVGIETRTPEAEKLAEPLLLHIAEEDQFVPKEAQAAILRDLKNHPQIEIHTYPGRDHAFARAGGEHYHEADARLAGGRTLQFFQRTLG